MINFIYKLTGFVGYSSIILLAALTVAIVLFSRDEDYQIGEITKSIYNALVWITFCVFPFHFVWTVYICFFGE
jgi:H+/gluconate symporter-like permease